MAGHGSFLENKDWVLTKELQGENLFFHQKAEGM